MKKLKIWNGRLYETDKSNIQYLNHEDSERRKLSRWLHCYVCATSVKHVIELAKKAGIHGITTSEIKVYWNNGCWGKQMDGITPEVGIWVVHGIHDEKPTRLI
ncbi:MAG: hypothetical protein WC375_05450 [Methanomassiliicoccales archaeon]|jgi:hypothetical protein